MKTRVMGLMMLAGYAAQANADAITATKKSGGQQVSDNLYGDVETRITSWRYFDANGNTQANRDLALRPKLGTKIMNERLDMNLTLPVVNKQNSAVTEQARPEFIADFSLFSSDLVDVSLNTTNYLKVNNAANYEGYIDFDVTLKHNIQTSAGKISLSLLLEAESNLTTNKANADIVRRERSDGLALTDAEVENADKPEQRETTKSLYTYPRIAFEPSVVPGLTLSLASYYGPTYKPKYDQTIDPVTGESKLKTAGYAVSTSTQNRYTIKYAINEQVSVYNQLRQNLDGFHAADVKGVALENRTGITVTLF